MCALPLYANYSYVVNVLNKDTPGTADFISVSTVTYTCMTSTYWPLLSSMVKCIVTLISLIPFVYIDANGIKS